jgi:adenylate kinase
VRLILLGAPGSGKGSVSDLVTRAYGLPRVSTGDLLRHAVRERTPLGLQAEETMRAGGLVPDALVIALVAERLAAADARRGYILDGFPRTVAQAESLGRLDPDRPEIVAEIVASEDVLVRRLAARRVCPRCDAVYNLISRPPRRPGFCDHDGEGLVQREDDTPEVILNRLRVYRRETEPLVGYYRAKGALLRIDGEGTVEASFEGLRPAVEAALAPETKGAAA